MTYLLIGEDDDIDLPIILPSKRRHVTDANLGVAAVIIRDYPNMHTVSIDDVNGGLLRSIMHDYIMM